MVQVIRKTKVRGEIEEHTMSFSDQEWELLQKHYPSGGVSFEVMSEQKPVQEGRDEDDDKPNMKDYNVVKELAMDHFRKEEWEKALYYFEIAYKLKSHGWISGKINTCKKNAMAQAK